MSIRYQLLIVALTTLVLPWAGCQYARELEGALRGAQEQSLLSSAGTIANALSAQPQRVFRDITDAVPLDARQGDFYVFPLQSAPLLDGYRDDWGVSVEPVALPSSSKYQARLQAGATDRNLYLFMEVDDARFDPEPNAPRPGQRHFDRVDMTFQRADGSLDAYFFATAAPGLIAAQTVAKSDDGEERIVEEPRIQAFWLQAARGYHLEVKVPLGFVGARCWIEARDGSGTKSAGVAAVDSPLGGRLFVTTPGLDETLATFIRAGTRAVVVDAQGFRLGSAGQINTNSANAADSSDGTWYRRLLAIDTSQLPVYSSPPDRLVGPSVSAALGGRPFAQWVRGNGSQELVLTAAAPIMVDDNARGAVVLEQAGDQSLALRDRAVTRLFDFTLLATASAVVVTFGFAAWLSARIGRLRSAADSAIRSDGTINLTMPESNSADEIGALAHAFQRLLARLDEHAHYLRTLGAKLAHELRTPLSIVRSSLDNLESEGLRPDQQGYVQRARDGTHRLQSILSALGAAARVEESIKQAERAAFDLRELLSSAIAGYRSAFTDSHIDLQTPDTPCFIRGAPELIVQLLDKLIENAVDFCPPGGAITVRVELIDGNYVLQVINDGPPIPAPLLGRLFESLFEHRPSPDDKPHFGLGLYIVRLIAEFHGGRAVAANRTTGDGAVFSVSLPLI